MDEAVIDGLEIAETATPPMQETSPRSGVTDPGRLLMLGGLLGVLFDACCGERLNGIGFPLYVVAYLGGLALAIWRQQARVCMGNVAALAIPLLFFAGMVPIRANEYLTFWNMTATIVLMLLLLFYIAADSVVQIGFREFLGAPWRVFGKSFAMPAPVVRDATASIRENRESRRQAMPIVRGLLLTVPVLFVFIGLLASADDLFARVLTDAGKTLLPKDWVEQTGHLCIALGAAWLGVGGIAYAITRKPQELIPAVGPDISERRGLRIGFTETMMVLGSVAVVFATFVAVQSTYFFGGIAYARSLGLNYATYARRGFWELVTVAVLALTLVHCLRAVGLRQGKGQERAFNSVGTALVGLTLILLASAIQRMHAYEAAWGATPLRLYVDGFIIWLGMALCWFAFTLWSRHAPFVIGLLACGVGYLGSLNLMNPDRVVAERHMVSYHRTGKLCMETIYKLSSDAVPTLCRLYESMPPGQQRMFLSQYLDLRRANVANRWHRWTSFHLSDAAAEQALVPLTDRLRRDQSADSCER